METKSEDSYYTNGHANGNGAPLRQVPTEGSITLTPEMFERLYLSPQNRVHGDLRQTLGNPTPVGLGGFLMAFAPLTFALLGWRGYEGALPGAATVGTYYFSGGILAWLAMIFELILGNTFPATFLGVFGGFFLSYGATITPAFAAYLSYNPSSPMEAVAAPGFLSGLGFWNISMAIFTFYCTICALRTNVLFTSAFFFLTFAFALNGASSWVVQETKTVMAHKLQVSAGATAFVTLCIGLYLLLAMMLASVDFPFNLPVGDLSTVIKGGSQLRKEKAHKDGGKNA